MQNPFSLLRPVLSWAKDWNWPQFLWNKPPIYCVQFKVTQLLRTGTFLKSFIAKVFIKSKRTGNPQCLSIQGKSKNLENKAYDFILLIGIDLMQNHWDGCRRKWAKPMNWAKLEFDWEIAWVSFAQFKHFQSLFIGKKKLEAFLLTNVMSTESVLRISSIDKCSSNCTVDTITNISASVRFGTF